jgi:Flp pilus assembly protein TadD
MKLLTTLGLAVLLAAAAPAPAAEVETTPAANAESRDYVAGKRAVQKKDWAAAAASFRKVVAAEPNNADAYTMLGYSLRWQGRMDDAFAAYDRALAIDPNHRGALEYLGVAYLKVNQPAKAQEQLAKLENLVGRNAEEYRDLARAISDYQSGKR